MIEILHRSDRTPTAVYVTCETKVAQIEDQNLLALFCTGTLIQAWEATAVGSVSLRNVSAMMVPPVTAEQLERRLLIPFMGPGFLAGGVHIIDDKENNAIADFGERFIRPGLWVSPLLSGCDHVIGHGDTVYWIPTEVGQGLLDRLANEGASILEAFESFRDPTILARSPSVTAGLGEVAKAPGAEETLNVPPPAEADIVAIQTLGHHRYAKVKQGRGAFAEVFLRIEPTQSGFAFVNEVTGGNIPDKFIPAVEQGVAEAMSQTSLLELPIQNLKVTVYDGKFHAADSSETAFQIAGRLAFLDAFQTFKEKLQKGTANIEKTPVNTLQLDEESPSTTPGRPDDTGGEKTTTGTDDWGDCDLCNEPIVKSTAKDITTAKLQQATKNGYCGKENPLASGMGFDKKTAWQMTLNMGAATNGTVVVESRGWAHSFA